METRSSSSSATTENMDVLSQFFRRSIGLQSILQSNLPKFRGMPHHADDMSLSEWLEEFNGVTANQNMEMSSKARLLLDHLSGPAREEIMCLSESKRQDFDEIVSRLKLCFGYQETTQTLSSQFHNRIQRDGESLCDFSRALIRTYNKMEKAATTQAQGEALSQLKNKTLSDQFVNGAREAWVRRELRRIQMMHETNGFAKIREEALKLFQETATTQRPRVREADIEVGRAVMKDSMLVQQVVEQQKAIMTELEQLRGEVARLKGGKPQRKRTDGRCFSCGHKGHLRRDCPNIPNGSPAHDYNYSAGNWHQENQSFPTWSTESGTMQNHDSFNRPTVYQSSSQGAASIPHQHIASQQEN
ncbi:uncharacterized protein LOC135157744 [Lytechinus pictus]|uniref:uncharacterized protein LOC135157744 n=1 Tax=Lytechinus pictus TaxID=7653 RepID=UPI00240DBBB0|nr:uncharacterized protein LOC129283206 [Lytechinus pictus]